MTGRVLLLAALGCAVHQALAAPAAIGYGPQGSQFPGFNIPDQLNPGDYLESPNRWFRLVLQDDGDLVGYKGPFPARGSNAYPSDQEYWRLSSGMGVDLQPGQYFLRAQNDGNLVLYDWTIGVGPIWRSDTAFTVPRTQGFTLRDDGTLVGYAACNSMPLAMSGEQHTVVANDRCRTSNCGPCDESAVTWTAGITPQTGPTTEGPSYAPLGPTSAPSAPPAPPTAAPTLSPIDTRTFVRVGYELTAGYAVPGENEVTTAGGKSVSDCMYLCASSSRPWCVSFDYRKSDKKCFLSKSTAATSYGSNFDYYQKIDQNYMWEELVGYAIVGHNIKEEVNTVNGCKDVCIADPECWSFDWKEAEGKCAYNDLAPWDQSTQATTYDGTLYRLVRQTSSPTSSPSSPAPTSPQTSPPTGSTPAPTSPQTSPPTGSTPAPTSGQMLTVPSQLTICQTVTLPDSVLATDADFRVPLESFGGGIVDFTKVKAIVKNGVVFDVKAADYSGRAARPAAVIATVTPAQSVFTARCTVATQCDVLVFLYHDPPASSSTNGDLPATLNEDDDWEPSSCAPTFSFPAATAPAADGCSYKMAAFRKKLGRGETADITLGAKSAQYFFVTVVPKVPCTNSMTESECNGTHEVAGETSTCVYTGDTCIDRYCAAAAAGNKNNNAPSSPTTPGSPTTPESPTTPGTPTNSGTPPAGPSCPAANTL